LIFVAGHPGRTDRANTVAHLLYQRDYVLPGTLNLLRRREVMLKNYSDRSAENARRAEDDLFSIQNSRKAYLGMLAGLQDPAILEKKRDAEKELREVVSKDPKLSQSYSDGWDQVAATLKTQVKIRNEYNLFAIGPQRRAQSFNSTLFDIAIKLVRLAEETSKPNSARLREYSEAGLKSLKLELFSDAPIYEDLETVQLADSLGMMAETMGQENESVQMVLAGKPRPSYSWSFESDGSIRVAAKEKPRAARIWQATNPGARDFRYLLGNRYSARPLEPEKDGGYVGRIEEPAKGWTAFFVELDFDSGGATPLKLSTQVRVLPDRLPHAGIDPTTAPLEKLPNR
jgi:hypothetical protein